MAERFDEPIPQSFTSIEKKLDELPPTQAQPYIYKVYKSLRDVNEKEYEPQLISIGPYHRGKDELKMMEKHKLKCLKQLIQFKPHVKVEDCFATVKEVEQKARDCYAESTDHLSSKEFIEMLVLDGCFIIELLIDREDSDREDSTLNDPIFQTLWIKTCLKRDMMLFENQIPFFVLCKLYDLIEGPNLHHVLVRHVLNSFGHLCPGTVEMEEPKGDSGWEKFKHILGLLHIDWCTLPSDSPDGDADANIIVEEGDANIIVKEGKRSGGWEKFKHILHLLHTDWCAFPSDSPDGDADANTEINPMVELIIPMEELRRSVSKPDSRLVLEEGKHFINSASELGDATFPSDSPDGDGDANISGEEDDANITVTAINPMEELRPSVSKPDSRPVVKGKRFINSASELGDANVKFQVLKESKTMFDVEFKQGIISIPPLIIEGETECVFRNLIAFEQYFPNEQPTWFTDYAFLLDCLIISSEDVKLLSEHGIIKSHLGNNETIAKIFNQITLSVSVNPLYLYDKTFHLINAHYKKPKNIPLPSIALILYISSISGALLLLLTIAQTVLSALQLP